VINKILILSIIIIYAACSPKYNIVKKFIPQENQRGGKSCIKEWLDKRRTILFKNLVPGIIFSLGVGLGPNWPGRRRG